MIPVKVNYNYFTLYKASSLNLKIIWSRRVSYSFFVFLRCRKFIRRSHSSRLSVIVTSDAIRLLLKWVDKNWSLIFIYKSCAVTYRINYYSWFLSRGTSRLIKWIYNERYELLYLLKRNNNLITARKPLSWNLCHVRPPANVEFLMSAEHLFQSIWK